jgi:hypothetical protein
MKPSDISLEGGVDNTALDIPIGPETKKITLQNLTTVNVNSIFDNIQQPTHVDIYNVECFKDEQLTKLHQKLTAYKGLEKLSIQQFKGDLKAHINLVGEIIKNHAETITELKLSRNNLEDDMITRLGEHLAGALNKLELIDLSLVQGPTQFKEVNWKLLLLTIASFRQVRPG